MATTTIVHISQIDIWVVNYIAGSTVHTQQLDPFFYDH